MSLSFNYVIEEHLMIPKYIYNIQDNKRDYYKIEFHFCEKYIHRKDFNKIYMKVTYHGIVVDEFSFKSFL